MKKPELSELLFWDSGINAIDWQAHADSVIVRVLERGDLEEFQGNKEILW